MKFLDAVAKVDELAKYNTNSTLCTVREEYYKYKDVVFTTTPIFGYYSQALESEYDYYTDVKNITPQDLLKDDYIILEYVYYGGSTIYVYNRLNIIKKENKY